MIPTSSSTATGIHERRQGSAHRLHPDLALLLSTSGSTGSPKLVRLSRCNLRRERRRRSPSTSISGETDRAATTLPMSYCYGLSVIHSHLLRGAGLILTDRSVVDDEFWTLFRRPPRHLVRRRALHLRDARPDRLRRHRPARSALRHPGRWPAVAGTRAQLRRARRAQRLAAVRHVRRDRGDRPNGLSATGTRAVAARLDRPSDPRRLVHTRTARRVARTRRRRAGVPRART